MDAKGFEVGQQVVCIAENHRYLGDGSPYYGGIYKIQGFWSSFPPNVDVTLENVVASSGEQYAFPLDYFRPRTDADVAAAPPPLPPKRPQEELDAEWDGVVRRLRELVIETGAAVTMQVDDGPVETRDDIKKHVGIN